MAPLDEHMPLYSPLAASLVLLTFPSDLMQEDLLGRTAFVPFLFTRLAREGFLL